MVPGVTHTGRDERLRHLHLQVVRDGAESEACQRHREAHRQREGVPEWNVPPLGVDNICLSVAANLTGAAIDSNNVLVSASKDGGAPIAVGFRAKKANGEYRCF